MLSEFERGRVQRRVVAILILSTVLGGLGVGASFSAGSLLIVEVSDDPALSGLAATMSALGAALAGLPLARLAVRRGRRVALATGNMIAVIGALGVVASAAAGVALALFASLAVLGVASAVQLQSRFAAADLALPERRARDLSLLVWSVTVGAVIGPNLLTPGERFGEWLGIPGLAGVFVFTVGAQLVAGTAVWLGLRPDPLLEAQRLDAHERARKTDGAEAAATGEGVQPVVLRTQPQWLVIALIALGHAVMVGLMAMTPLHLSNHGGSITLVGVVISLHIAGMYALSPLFGYLTRRLGSLRVVAIGFGVLALSAAGTGFGGDLVWVIQVALILLGLGWGLVTIAGAVLLTDLTPQVVRAKRQGQSDTTMNTAGAVFGALSGAIFAFGGFPLLSVVAGALIAAAAFIMLKVRRELAR